MSSNLDQEGREKLLIELAEKRNARRKHHDVDSLKHRREYLHYVAITVLILVVGDSLLRINYLSASQQTAKNISEGNESNNSTSQNTDDSCAKKSVQNRNTDPVDVARAKKAHIHVIDVAREKAVQDAASSDKKTELCGGKHGRLFSCTREDSERAQQQYLPRKNSLPYKGR